MATDNFIKKDGIKSEYCTVYDSSTKCRWFAKNYKSCNGCAYKTTIEVKTLTAPDEFLQKLKELFELVSTDKNKHVEDLIIYATKEDGEIKFSVADADYIELFNLE